MKFRPAAISVVVLAILVFGTGCTTVLNLIGQGAESVGDDSTTTTTEGGDDGFDEDLGIYAPPATPEWSPPRVVDPSVRARLFYGGETTDDDIRLYNPRIEMSVRGHIEPDDYALVSLFEGPDHDEQLGDQLECPVDERTDGGRVECEFPEGLIDSPGLYSAKVAYRDGATGEVTEDWRTLTFQVEWYYATEEERGLYVNNDHRLDEAWAVVNRDSRTPYLSLMFFTAPEDEESASYTGRCFDEDGEQFSDPDDRVYVDENDIYDERNEEYLGYRHVEIRSWRIQGPQGPNVTSDAPNLVDNPGEYECRINIDGKPARVLRFTMNEDGSIERHPQTSLDDRDGMLGVNYDEYRIEQERVGDYDRDIQEEHLDNFAFFAPDWLDGTGEDVGTADNDFEDRPFMHATVRMTTTEVNSGVQNQGDIVVGENEKIQTETATDENGDPIIFSVDEEVRAETDGKMGQTLTLEVPMTAETQGEYNVPAGDITDPYSSLRLIDDVTNPEPADVIIK